MIYKEVYLNHNTLGGIFLGVNKTPPSGKLEPVPERKHGDGTVTNSKVERGPSSALPSLQVRKADLLKHIKILHFTAHGRADCQPLASRVPTLLSPDLVRIVCPRTQERSYDSNLCGRDFCPLLHRINTKKIVFRIIDFYYGPDFDDDFGVWKASQLQEIVYFLPARGWYDHDFDQKAEKVKLVIGETTEPTRWDFPYGPNQVPVELSLYGPFKIRELVPYLSRPMDHCRVLEIVGLETILLREEMDPDSSPDVIITEEQLLSVQEELGREARRASGEVTKQLICKTRQQYHREDSYGEFSREEKEKWLEEDKLGAESLDDTTSSSDTGPDL